MVKGNGQVMKLERKAEMLRVIAHPLRIGIIDLLNRKKKLSVSDIQMRLRTTQSMTSQHLSSLRNVGIVGFIKEGNVCYYSLTNKNVLKLLKCLNDCACTD